MKIDITGYRIFFFTLLRQICTSKQLFHTKFVNLDNIPNKSKDKMSLGELNSWFSLVS